jgi:hypothetical protein
MCQNKNNNITALVLAQQLCCAMHGSCTSQPILKHCCTQPKATTSSCIWAPAHAKAAVKNHQLSDSCRALHSQMTSQASAPKSALPSTVVSTLLKTSLLALLHTKAGAASDRSHLCSAAEPRASITCHQCCCWESHSRCCCSRQLLLTAALVVL